MSMQFLRENPTVVRDPLSLLCERMHKQVMMQREQIIEAFIAQHGCLPSECIQVCGQYGEWFVRRMSPEEVILREKVEKNARVATDVLCEIERLRAKLRETKRYLRAANKGAERNALVAQLAAERNVRLANEMHKAEQAHDG